MSHSWVELDMEILRSNLSAVRGRLDPDVTLIFVVKANAYGHGLLPVARCAWACGVRQFAVAHLEEGLQLRSELPGADILIVVPIAPDEAPNAAEAGLTVLLADEAHGRALAARLRGCPRPLRCHAKIDTGMGRLGFAWETAHEPLASLRGLRELTLEGACTHFSATDDPDAAFTDLQASRFSACLRACERADIRFDFTHAANSGALRRGLASGFHGVRAGILLYGYGGAAGARGPLTEPFLQWKTRVVQTKCVPAGFPVSYDRTHTTSRPTQLATIAVGYGDGFSRRLSGRGAALIRGRPRRVVGRVTMNLTVLDCGPRADVVEGDEVVLIGRQGRAAVWADDMARRRGTISYEVLTDIRTTDRRPRG